MGRKRLGEFQQHVMWAVIRLGEDAYGMRVRRALEKVTGDPVSIGAVYATLDRLEDKGFVTSKFGQPLPERGGRARRYFEVTSAGAAAVQESRRIMASWEPEASP